MTENKNNKKIRNDIIFIAVLLLVLTVIGVGILAFGKTGFFTGKKGNTVKVVVAGKIYGEYSLNVNKTVEIKSDRGHNILVIEDGEAYVREASCPDGVCSSHKPINIVGESIICLPNQVVVSIEGGVSADQDDSGGIDIIS